jgi:nucleotide-binding universal stress UspA family protein
VDHRQSHLLVTFVPDPRPAHLVEWGEKPRGDILSDRQLIVVGVDGSEHSITALQRAVEEAVRRDAELHVVYVSDLAVELFRVSGAVPIDATEIVRMQKEGVWEVVGPEIERLGYPGERVSLEGYPADTMVDYCNKKEADLLVLGTRGRGRLASTFLGSTSMRAMEQANCDVLIAKRR